MMSCWNLTIRFGYFWHNCTNLSDSNLVVSISLVWAPALIKIYQDFRTSIALMDGFDQRIGKSCHAIEFIPLNSFLSDVTLLKSRAKNIQWFDTGCVNISYINQFLIGVVKRSQSWSKVQKLQRKLLHVNFLERGKTARTKTQIFSVLHVIGWGGTRFPRKLQGLIKKNKYLGILSTLNWKLLKAQRILTRESLCGSFSHDKEGRLSLI